MMSVVETVLQYGRETGQSMRTIADQLHIDHTLISKAKHGKYKFPDYMDSTLASLNWRVALEVIDERSGGYISNILKLDPDIDLSPAGLKERLQKDLQEALSSLGDVYMFEKEPDKRALEKAWHEMTDVIEVATVARGVYEEQFQLNHKELVKIHNQQRKEHRR
jgi:RNA-binding protein YhbY